MPVFPSNGLITDTLNLIKNDTPHLALYTVAPTASGGGTEVNGGSYARKSVTFGSISSGSMSNSSAITFSGLPSSTIVAWGILDASTSGNLLCFGTLSSSVTVVAGDQLQFNTGNIQINLSGS